MTIKRTRNPRAVMIGAVDLAHRHRQTAAPRHAEMRKAIAVQKERNAHLCSAAVADGGRDKRPRLAKRDPG